MSRALFAGFYFNFFEKNGVGEKFFLAKRLGEVYIDRANACIMIMKKLSLYLLFVSVLGISPLHGAEKWAADASDVRVNLSLEDARPEIKAVPIQVDKVLLQDKRITDLMKNAKSVFKPVKQDWYVVNIPIEIKALGRKENKKTGKSELCPARYVDELKIKAYVLVENGKSKKDSEPKGEDYFLLEKELTYVDIPMESVAKKGGDGFTESDGAGYAKMSVGLFISPAAAMKLSDTPDKADAKFKVVAVAIAPTFKGSPCRTIPKDPKKAPMDFVSDQKLYRLLKTSTQWWKGATASHFVKTSTQLLSIAETPFAPYYACWYPALKPMYGEAPAASSSSSSAAAAEDDDSSTTSTSTSTSSSTTSTRDSE